MKGWKNLGVVETIYEEEYEFSSSSSSLSPSPSSPTPLHSKVEAWSLAAGRKADVVIRVGGKCFHMHKEPLTSRSTYLKRLLTESITELTLSPPLNIAAETFTLVADFCYGARLVITPFNLAALRTAAELLEMTETNGVGDDNLVQITDSYFRQVIAVNRQHASIVFRSCLSLLPEAETAAFLLSKCVEAMNLTDDDNGNGDDDDDVDGVDWFNNVLTVCPEDFHIVAESMQRRFTSHDGVYKLVDFYIREHSEKITEEQKIQICNSIDCSKLSAQLLMEAVQNPTMPLRFIVRAMLVEQLNTRRCIFSTALTQPRHLPPPPAEDSKEEGPITLGAILQREAAIRQSEQLKATLNATSLRIQSLEEELNGMKKKLLNESEKRSKSISIGSGRSASFHLGTENKITMGDKMCASSASFRFFAKGSKMEEANSSTSCKAGTPRVTKTISRRLMNGLKKAFRVRSSESDGPDESETSRKVDRNGRYR